MLFLQLLLHVAVSLSVEILTLLGRVFDGNCILIIQLSFKTVEIFRVFPRLSMDMVPYSFMRRLPTTAARLDSSRNNRLGNMGPTATRVLRWPLPSQVPRQMDEMQSASLR